MMAPTDPLLHDEALDRRQRRLLVMVWASTLLPLLAFGYLTWQSLALNTQVQQAQDTLTKAEQQLAEVNGQMAAAIEQLGTLNADLKEQQRSTAHYRDFAGIKIRFYRESDRAIVQKALVDQGFTIDASLGTSPLIARELANTLAYGSLVSQEDVKTSPWRWSRRAFRCSGSRQPSGSPIPGSFRSSHPPFRIDGIAP